MRSQKSAEAAKLSELPATVSRTGLVGRDDELRVVSRFLASPSDHVLFISGEPGIGKSALIEAALERSRTPHFTVRDRSRGKWPYSSALSMLASVANEPALAVVKPRFREILGLFAPGKSPGTFDTSVVLERGTDMWRAIPPEHRPQVFVLHGAERFDPATVDFCVAMLDQAGVDTWSFIITVASDDLELAAGYRTLHLAGLSPAEAHHLLCRATDVRQIPRSVISALVAQTGGNPASMLDVATQLDECQLKGSEPLPHPLPVSSALRRRIWPQDLPAAEHRRVLALFAHHDTIAHSVLTKFSDDEQIDRMHRDKLIVAGDGSWAPSIRTHSVLAWATLSVPEQLSLHLAAATAWIGRDLNRATYHQLHADSSGSLPDLPLATKLVGTLLSRGSGDEGEHLLRLLVGRFEASAPADLWVLLAQVQLGRGFAVRARESLREAELAEPSAEVQVDILSAWMELELLTGGDPYDIATTPELDRLTAAASDRMKVFLIGWSQVLVSTGAFDTAAELITRSQLIDSAMPGTDTLGEVVAAELALAKGTGDARRMKRAALAWMNSPARVDRSWIADFLVVKDLLAIGAPAEARRLAEQVGVLGNGGVARQVALLRADLYERKYAAALHRIDAFAEQKLGAAGSWLSAHVPATRMRAAYGTSPRFQRVVDRSMGVLEPWPDDADVGPTTAAFIADRGFAELVAGDDIAASVLFASALRQRANLPQGAATVLADLVEALVGQHRGDEAARYLWEYLPRLPDRASPLASVVLARAEALTAQPDQAAESFGRALELASRSALDVEYARVQIAWAKFDGPGSPTDAAKQRLLEARVIMNQLDLMGWVAHIDALIDRGTTRQSDDRWSLLSPEETMIVNLVGSGRTTSEIADAMYVSVRTAGSRLAGISKKLGISTKAELRMISRTRRVEPPPTSVS